MMIKNVTKKKTLLKNFEPAYSIGRKTRGLMFSKKLPKDSGLLMFFETERKHEIWTFAMRFAIDIVFIDKNKRVVDIKHSVRPIGKNPKTWRVYRPKKPCSYVLEANAGVAKRTKTEVGDLLDF